MLFNTTNLPSVRVQLRQPDSRNQLEHLTSLIDVTASKQLLSQPCDNKLMSDFNYLLLSETESRALAFNRGSSDQFIQEFIDSPHEFTLLRITGIAPSDINPTVATKPITTDAEMGQFLARFPFLFTSVNEASFPSADGTQV